MEKKREENYMKWFDEVKTTYLSMLNNRIVFEKKLEMLDVKFFDGNSTSGMLLPTINTKVYYDFCMEVNKNDSKVTIMYFMAHELTHLLFAETDLLQFTGYSSNDDSVSVSHVRRKLYKTSEIYGTAFEEELCEYIAFSVVKHIFKDTYTENEIMKLTCQNEVGKFTYNNFLLMQEIIKYFGSEITDKIDEIEVLSETVKKPGNYLLYTATSGTLNILINDFDDYTYKGAWLKLNKLFEEYWNDNSKVYLRRQIKEILKMWQKNAA